MDINPIYKFMKDNGLTQKDESTFVSEYSNPQKSAELHKFMTDNSLTTKGADDFYNEYFNPSKKKGGTTKDSGGPGKPSAPSFGQKVVDEAITQEVQIPLRGQQKAPVQKKPYQDITYKREQLPSETTQMPETPVVKAAKKDFKENQIKPQVQLKSTPEELEAIEKKTENVDKNGLVLNEYQSTGEIFTDLEDLNEGEDVNAVFSRIQRRPDLYAKYSGRTPEEVANLQGYETRELYEADRDLVYKNYLADLQSQRLNHEKSVAKANVVIRDILNEKVTPETYGKYTKDKTETTMMGEIVAGPVVDMDKIDEEASAIAEKYNIPPNGAAWRLIKNNLTSDVDTEIDRPQADVNFKTDFAELNTKRQELFDAGFKADETIYANAEAKLNSLEAQYQQEAKNEFDAIDFEYKAKADQLNKEYAQYTDGIKKQQESLTALYQSGQIDQLAYESEWGKLAEDEKVFYENYKREFPDNAAYVVKSNEINSRYNRKYEQQKQAIASRAEAEMQEAYKKYALEYKEDPELLKKMNEAYKASFEKATQQRVAKMGKAAQLSANPISTFYQSTASALGGVFKGWGGSMDSKTLEVLGESMEQSFMMPQARTKEFSDWIDPQNIILLSGQLAGSMLPSMTASAAVAIGTQGAGLPVAAQLIAGGLAGWASETVDIVGRSYLDRFEGTGGNVAEANLAAERSLQSQYDIMFSYSLDALPFVGKALKFIPTMAGRVAAGAGAELLTEMVQEYPQNIADENIQAGNEPWANLNEALKDTKRMKETLISIGPVAILGGAGQIGTKSKKSELRDAYIAMQQKSSLNNALPDQKRQYIQNMVFNKNAKFAKGVIGTLFASGKIDEKTSTDMLVEIDRAEKIKQAGKSAGLSGSKLNIYGFYSARAEEAERNAAKFGQDPILSESYKQMAKQYRDAGLDFMKGGKPDLLSVTYADGSQALMVPEDANALFSDANALNLLSKKAVSISAYKEGGQGVKIIDELKGRAETYAKKNRYTEASKMASPLQSLRENIQQRTEQLDIEQAELTEAQRQAEIKRIEQEETAAFEAKEKELEQQRRDQRDVEIEQIQQQREALGVNEVDAFFSDMKPLVGTTVERMEQGKPAPQSAVKVASDYLYAKYKELTAMKSDPNRMMTIAQIESIQAQIEQDLETLEGNPPSQKTETNDKENIQGVPGEVGVGQEPVTTEPVEGTGTETTEAGGVLQAPGQEEVELELAELPTVTVEGEVVEVTPTTETVSTPFQKQKDLLGDDKQAWMYEATEAERNQAKNATGKNTTRFFPKKISKIKDALQRGLFEKAIKEGRMTAQQAADVISSAGLEVPASIQSKIEEATPTPKSTKPTFKQRISMMFDPEGAKAAEDLARFHQEAGIEVEIIDDVEAKRLGQERNMEGNLEGLFIADKESGKIYLNRDALKRVGKTLAYHEGIHPVINIIRNTNPELYKKIVDGIRAEAKRNPAVARAIRQVESVKEYQKRGPETIEDEIVVEVLARIAAGDIDLNKFDKTLKDNFIDLLNWLGKKLRIGTIKTNPNSQEMRDFAKKLSTALTEGGKLSDVVGAENVKAFAPPTYIDSQGNEITEEDVKYSLIDRFTDPKNGFTFEYMANSKEFEELKKNGQITEDKTLDDFVGKYLYGHSPDAAFTGNIKKKDENGKEITIVEGKGGVFYPIKFIKQLFVWASTASAANSMAKQLNENAKKNGGPIYLALVSAPEDKLLSSTTASNGVIDTFKAISNDVSGFGIPDNVFKNALLQAAKATRVNAQGKTVGLNLNKLTETNTVEEIESAVRKSLAADVSIFDDRKTFSLSFIKAFTDAIKNTAAEQKVGKFIVQGIEVQNYKQQGKIGEVGSEKYKLSPKNMVSAISQMLGEPMLRGESSKKIYAIIEITPSRRGGGLSSVKPVNSKLHESYPKAIKLAGTGMKVKVHILQDRELWTDRLADPETGKPVTADREKRVFPTSGVTTTSLEVLPKQTPASKPTPVKGQPSVSIDRSKAPVTIEPIDFENESENIDVYEASEQASKIAKDNGVNILRGKDLKSVALDDEGNVVGGLWTEISGDEFSFDVAVDKSMQGKGVGEKLVNEAISEFNAENFEDQLKYKVDVTNPVMEKLLSKYGFEVTERIDGHTMMEHPTNNPKLKRGQASVSIDRSKSDEEITLKDGSKVKPTNISGQTNFFHASSKKREGKLKPNMAPQWGKAIYFATSRQAATDEFGGDNVTEASLNLKKPVYTNTTEFREINKKAAELYNREMLPNILKDEAELVNGKWNFFDEDLQAEYNKNGYIDKYSSSDIEEGKYFGDAAKELGYDAIIDEGGQYGTEIAVLDENAVIYPEDMKPKSDLETIEEKGGTVYHGGEIVDLKSIKENEPFFVTESESEAIAYSKGNSGDVFVAKIDLSKIGNEEVARNILKKMGYSDEYMLHELIDPRFEESYIGKNNVKKLYSEIEEQGYIGISFNDTGIAKKKQVTNIFLVSPKETLSNSGFETNKIVNEWRSSELLEQGYLPVIDGKIVQNPTEEELNNYFSKNEYLNMVKPSVSKGQFSANIPRTSSEIRQSMEDSGDAVEQAIASGTDPQTAVDSLIGSQDWYKELTPNQKQQFDEILQDEFGVTPKAPAKKPTGIKSTIANLIDNYYKLKDKDKSARDAIDQILDADPKLNYIYKNIRDINKQLQAAGVITEKTDGCP